jgi:DNA topoisomerase I
MEENSEGLIHVSDRDPGFTRKKQGRGFIYLDRDGKRINDVAILERIKKLGIPPGWNKIWISCHSNGYLQATGLDAKNRKQYIYHQEWISWQQTDKFDRLREFAHTLPAIRKVVAAELRKDGWHRNKVLSLIISVLDETYVRIGNKHYYKTTGTQGLTTLRKKNMKFRDDGIIFQFLAKGKKVRTLKIKSTKLLRLIRECSELPGYEVFRYIDEKGRATSATSEDVNRYLKEITGKTFTTKDFRTWGATVTAVRKHPVALRRAVENKKIKLKKAIVKEVAGELDNTISVCEKYYIHPAVLEVLDENFIPEKYIPGNLPLKLSIEEKVALGIIEDRTNISPEDQFEQSLIRHAR